MNQTARVLSVYGSFLRGAGQHLTFYECVADLVEKGGSIEDVAELVYNTWTCSECGYTVDTYNADELTRFCPSCGAKMEVGY